MEILTYFSQEVKLHGSNSHIFRVSGSARNILFMFKLYLSNMLFYSSMLNYDTVTVKS